MLLLRERRARQDVGTMLLLKLLLLALLLMLPPLNLVLRVVCHDALFVNTTECSLAPSAADIATGAKEYNVATYNRSIRYGDR